MNFWQTARSEKLIRVVIKCIAHKGAMVCSTTETLWMKKKMMSFKSLAIKYTQRQSIKRPLYLNERAFFVSVLLIHSEIIKTTTQYRQRWGQQLLPVFFPPFPGNCNGVNNEEKYGKTYRMYFRKLRDLSFKEPQLALNIKMKPLNQKRFHLQPLLWKATVFILRWLFWLC